MERFKAKVLHNTLILNGLVLFGVVVLGGGYVIQINQAAEIGQTISDLEAQIDELEIASQQLEYQAASRRSMHSVSRRVSILGMVPATDVDYITTASNVAFEDFATERP